MAISRPSYSTLSLVRLAYPDPVPSFWVSSRTGGDGPPQRPLYCVGGALYMFINGISMQQASQGERFPSVDRISAALQTLNPALGRLAAFKYASAIIRANDSGFPDGPRQAWDITAKALGKSDAVPAGKRHVFGLLRRIKAHVRGATEVV